MRLNGIWFPAKFHVVFQNLNVVKQGHKTEVHVQLLVAMEQRESRVIGNEIEYRLPGSLPASLHLS